MGRREGKKGGGGKGEEEGTGRKILGAFLQEGAALTGVVGHELLQAAELRAGGDVEATTVQLADLVVLYIEALGIVKVRHRQAVGTCRVGQRGGPAMTTRPATTFPGPQHWPCGQGA